MTAVIDAYDAAVFDLDGVIYVGDDAVPGVPAAIASLAASGVRLGFVTNNAARSPQVVAGHLQRLGIPVTAADIVTSAQAVARLLQVRFPAGSGVLVTGSAALADEVRSVGLVPVASSSDRPAAVVVGFEPSLTWADINDACFAVQAGAAWYGCNPDLTRPTRHGEAIGLGTMLAAMQATLPGHEPILAGKPCRPLLDETLRRLGATRPVFVGDRLDTDIEGAHVVGIDSLFVLSGSHGPQDLLVAAPDQRPTYIGSTVAALLEPPVGHGDGPLDDLWRRARAAWTAADQAAAVPVT